MSNICEQYVLAFKVKLKRELIIKLHLEICLALTQQISTGLCKDIYIRVY